jgi:hypothetical protein
MQGQQVHIYAEEFGRGINWVLQVWFIWGFFASLSTNILRTPRVHNKRELSFYLHSCVHVGYHIIYGYIGILAGMHR